MRDGRRAILRSLQLKSIYIFAKLSGFAMPACRSRTAAPELAASSTSIPFFRVSSTCPTFESHEKESDGDMAEKEIEGQGPAGPTS